MFKRASAVVAFLLALVVAGVALVALALVLSL